jgi:hypothetical protein
MGEPNVTAATISLSGNVLTWSLTINESPTNTLPAGYYFAVSNGQGGVAPNYSSESTSADGTSYTFLTPPQNGNIISAQFGPTAGDAIVSNSITIGEGAAPGGAAGNPSQSVTITAATIFLSGSVLTWSLTMSDESTTTTLPVGSYFAVSHGEGEDVADYTNIIQASANMKSYKLSHTPTGDNYLVSAKFSSTSSTLEDGIVSNSITNTTVEFVSVHVNTSGLITWILKNSNKDTKKKKIMDAIFKGSKG